MARSIRAALAAFLVVLLVPNVAYAQGSFSSADFNVHLVMSLVGLIVAAWLLFQALGVRKLAYGAALSERMGLVVLAVVCLAASAIAEWSTNFAAGITLDQAQLASELLVVVAMALLAAYFFYVRSSMKTFLDATKSALEEEIALEDGPASEEQESERA